MRTWYHSPDHRFGEGGAYIVTAGTYRKIHLFHDASRLTLLHDTLLELAGKYEWRLQAWAVFSNHYHFIAFSPANPSTLGGFINNLHAESARQINRRDGAAGRKVWYQYWDTHLTYELSYLARLNYVHSNAVHHKLVAVPTAYPWCSAAWFERNAPPGMQRKVASFSLDQPKVLDDFDQPLWNSETEG
jgi:putative transposase